MKVLSKRCKIALGLLFLWVILLSILLPSIYFTMMDDQSSVFLQQNAPALLRYLIPFQHRIELVQIDIPVSDQHDHVRGLRFLQLSDIHSDVERSALSDKVLYQLAIKVKLLHRRHRIDFLLITGDFVHGEVEESVKRLHEQFFSLLPEDLKIYGSLGNHDLMMNKKRQLVAFLKEQCRVHLLDNDYVMLRDERVMIVGLGDYIHNGGSDFHYERVREKMAAALIEQGSQKQKLSVQSPYVITMSHNPVSAECLLDDKTERKLCDFGNGIRSDLVCSGHTHATQIRLPILHVPLLPIIYRLLPQSFHQKISFFRNYYNAVGKWEWVQGLIGFGNSRYMYINRGIGSHLGLRIACRPEITMFHLV